ncbi:MAG: hypothetical protein WC372_00200 [Candidatus Neomarinimicrobiota bacterium]|jgi:hypothetical protein|nr:hypothetical protein [Candidatus Neomarinimicrobiota bacterium]MDD3965608.1 hypothetical protein [Candidatus Neomarinimicrobiota bacterium]MDX9779410.1 hypothetical protein [bacterium]
MKRFLLLFLLLTGLAAAAPSDLETAHQMSDAVFRGWTYGSYSSAKKQLDCSTFISAVMDTLLSRRGIHYTAEMRRDVLINHPDFGRNLIKEGPDPADPRYAGMVHMMEKYGVGIRIRDLSQVQPGDFIQYWVRRNNGTWFGHASLIESLSRDAADGRYKARIYGSHKSMNGIAVSNFELMLEGKDRYVYIGRLQDKGN